MSVSDAAALPPARAWIDARRGPYLLAAFAVTATGAMLVATGAARLPDGLSTDDAMRLVQVRDLLAGQGWHDLVPRRLDPAHPTPSHWSRLADLPIAALIAVFGLLLAPAQAEVLTMAVYPLLLLALIGGGAAYAGAALAGPRGAAGATILVVMSSAVLGHARMGALDHHGLQIALLLFGAGAAARAADRLCPRAGAAAGGLAVLSLAVGMEMAPLWAAFGAGLAVVWIARGRAAAAMARGYGLALVAAAAAAFALVVAPGRWGEVRLDAFSILHLALLLAAGTGLVALTALPLRDWRARLAAAGALGALGAAAALAAAPGLRAGAIFGAMDPMVKRLWLDHVAEARSLLATLRSGPGELVGTYLPLLAALALGAAAARRDRRAGGLIVLCALALACATAVWAIRGGAAAAALAAVVAGAAAARLGGPAHGGRLGVRMLALLMAANPMPYQAAAAALKPPAPPADGADSCLSLHAMAALARLPAGAVMSSIDVGPFILAATPHRVFGAPYHRNDAGNRDALLVMIAPPAHAERLLRARGADYVAYCRTGAEAAVFAADAPGGLMAALLAGRPPAYLEPAQGARPDDAMTVWRVRPAPAQ